MMRPDDEHLAQPDTAPTEGRDGLASGGSGTCCAHCTLPVPPVELRAGEPLQFCCGGCRAVHGALAEAMGGAGLGVEGVARYYAMREEERASRGLEASPATVSGRGFESLDDEGFLARHALVAQDGRRAVELRIDGIRCGACVWLLEALPRIERGVDEVRVDGARGTARIVWRPSACALSQVARRFDALGYQLAPFADPDGVLRERMADRRWLVRLGVSAAIASNAMAVAFALYGGLFSAMADGYRIAFQWCSVVLAVVALAWPGRIFLTNAIAAVRTRTPHMDVPVAFGLVAAVLAGAVMTAVGTGSIYCESASMLVFLLLAGRYVQYGRQRKAREEVELLLAIVPSVARRVGTARKPGPAREVPIESLEPGDLVEVTSGETCPADGRLVSAATHADLSHLTGESRPISVEKGAPVYAGSRILEGPARVEVVVAGAETRAARLLALVREASRRRAPVEELANRMAGWFLVCVLVSAAATLAWWWPILGADEAIARAVAMLVVTCPCALGLATPLAVVAGLGKGARRGVLVKGGDVLERASRAGTLVLDKTGTVTEARTTVVDWAGEEEALLLAGAVEAHSAHPLARAIVQAFGGSCASEGEDGAVRAIGLAHVHETPGQGIEGIASTAAGKRIVRVGSARYIESRPAVFPDGLREKTREFAARGLAPVVVSIHGRVEAVVGIGDPVRPEAAVTVELLKKSGWRVVLASGDDPVVAAGVARQIGIAPSDAHGGLSPEAKLEFVRRSDLPRPVVMVGDGVNDLAALAAADVGVAVRNGAQASHHVADVCLAASGIRPLARFLEGARTSMHAIRVNLGISVGYNALGGALAFAGLVNPLVAAILMPLSGLTVLVLAMRMPSFRLPDDPPRFKGGC